MSYLMLPVIMVAPKILSVEHTGKIIQYTSVGVVALESRWEPEN